MAQPKLSGFRLPSDPHLRRWMLFVDGENFTVRGHQYAEEHGLSLATGEYYEPGVFLWFPGIRATKALTNAPDRTLELQPQAIRAFYYTSVVGDEPRLLAIRQSLRSLGFEPQVFKKSRKDQKAKGVDIALATDLLSNAYHHNFDVAVIVAGDGDYLPLVSEVKRLGKVVHLAFFSGKGYGLNPELRLAADLYFDAEIFFESAWKEHIDNSRVGPWGQSALSH